MLGRQRSSLRRLLVQAGFVVGVMCVPMVANAETNSPPEPGAAVTDGALRERVAKLEERCETQRQYAEKTQAELADTKKQLEELSRTAYIATGILTFVVGALAFLLGRVKTRVEKDGPKAIVDSVIEKLYAEDAERFMRLFRQHRNELVRVIMARDQPIAFIGSHEDHERIKDSLKTIGYEGIVDSPAKAKIAIVFCEQGTFPKYAEELAKDVKTQRIPKRLVLYSAGGVQLKPESVRELNRWAMAVPATSPTTAATQTATLAALAQPVK